MKRMMWVMVCTTIAWFGTTLAQSHRTGITGGVNISNFNGIRNASAKNGLVVGVFTEYDLVPGLALQPEVLFSMKGATGTPQNPVGLYGTYDITLNYIEIPVLLKFNMVSVPILPVNLDVYAGPDFAFNVASKEVYTSGDVTTTTDESSQTRPFDFNIAVGGGPNVDLGPLTLGAELRYTFATGSPFKSGGANFGYAKNGVWSVMLSAAF